MTKLENPDGSKLDFNDISLESLGVHLLFGEVNEDSMKAAVEFVLKANLILTDFSEITLCLNTIGGNCYDGFALMDVMNVSRLPVKTVGMGNIVSMGVFLLSAGYKGKRVMTKNTQVMAHQHFGGNGAKFHELVSSHKSELYLHSQMMHHFLTHTNMSEKQIKDIVLGPTDRWLSPAECKKLGIVDHVVDELPDFNLDLNPFQPLPASAKPKRRAR